MAQPPRQLYTIAEAMEVLRRSRALIWRDLRDGRLEFITIGRSRRITAASLDRVLANGAPLAVKRKRLRVVERE